MGESNRLREYREGRGFTQPQTVAAAGAHRGAGSACELVKAMRRAAGE